MRRIASVRWMAVLAMGLSLVVLTSSVACAQSAEIAALRKEIEELKAMQKQMAEDLAQLRDALGQKAPVIDLKGVAMRGSPETVVTLVEFSDYECPFCIRHFQQTRPQIEANYIKSGKIQYAFRDFPIDQLHPQAIKAHEAAHCAAEQNKYWEAHERLFAAPANHTPAALERLATDLGLDLNAFKGCIASGRTTAGIRASAAVADSFRVSGTPAFFVGTLNKATGQVRVLRAISGAVPYEQFASVLDAVIAGVAKK